MRVNAHLTRLSGFAAASVISAVVPLFALPVVARVGGPDDWTALGLGQSVGAFASIVVSWGWAIQGPIAVARADQQGRMGLLRSAHGSRLTMLAGSIPIMFAVCWFVAPPGYLSLTMLAAVGMAIGGLTHYWYAIGAKSPRIYITLEIIPRIALILGSIPVILVTRQVMLYPIALIGAGLISFVAFSWTTSSLPRSTKHFADGFSVLREQRSAAATTLAMGSYVMLPVVIMGFVTPSAELVPFISADRLYKLCVPVVTTLNSTLLGWVSEQVSSRITTRMKLALRVHIGLGIFGGLCIAIAGPKVTSILFGGELATTWPISFCYGVAFFALAVNTSLSTQILVPLNNIRSVLLSTVTGALVGVAIIIGAGSVYGPIGGAIGVASGELVVLIAQVTAVARLWRIPRELAAAED